MHALYPIDPPWDGAGCGANSTMLLSKQPSMVLEAAAIYTDDIEMRMCRDQGKADEGTPIEMLELYIH